MINTLAGIGRVTYLFMILGGVWLSVTKKASWILVLGALSALWVFANSCLKHSKNADVRCVCETKYLPIIHK